MHRFKSIPIFIITTLLCFHSIFNISEILSYHHYLEEMGLKQEAQQIYYTIGTDNQYYCDFHSFKLDPSLNEQVSRIEGVNKVYPFTSISNTLNNQYQDKTTVKVNGQTVQKDYHLWMRILPYYPEDRLDDKMQKIFIGEDLLFAIEASYQNELNMPFTLEAEFNLPIFNHQEDCVQISYEKQWLSFDINELVDNYFSSLYNEGAVILVPFQKMEEICQKQFDMQVVYLEKDVSHQSVVDKIETMCDEVYSYCGKLYYEDAMTDGFDTYDLPEFFLNVVIVLVLMVLNVFVIKKLHANCSRQGFFNWVISIVAVLFFLRYEIMWEDFIVFVVCFAVVVALMKKKK